MIEVRPVVQSDAIAWQRMREALWPSAPGEHAGEIERFFAREVHEPLAVLIAFDQQADAIGFAELNIRNYAEDCTTNAIAYLEGWYVEPHARRRGVGAALVRAAEDWGRAQGCTEFASDALIDNDVSAAAHAALGFTETARIRCFRKDL